jgi:hypothetical protein
MTAAAIGNMHDNHMIPAICETEGNYAKSRQSDWLRFGYRDGGRRSGGKSALNARIIGQFFLVS